MIVDIFFKLSVIALSFDIICELSKRLALKILTHKKIRPTFKQELRRV